MSINLGIHVRAPWPWRKIMVVNEDTGETAYAWSWWRPSLFRAFDAVTDPGTRRS